jgi:spermidine synthase
MSLPWITVDSVATAEGQLDLLQKGEDEWLITIDKRPLMSSRLHRSEIALAEMACDALREHRAPRALVAGLGMGYTLRAALDVLPSDAEVVTAEINRTVASWNRGPLKHLSGRALEDPRVQLEIVDVSELITAASQANADGKFDAIILDLYEGPYPPPKGTKDLCFSDPALLRTRAALRRGGCLAVWSEGRVEDFPMRMNASGFRVECHRPKYKGPRHIVYLGWPA